MTAMQQALAAVGQPIRRVPTFKSGKLLNENPGNMRDFPREGEKKPKPTPVPAAWKGSTGPMAGNKPRRPAAPGMGGRIREYRQERKISQNELASFAGLNHGHISRIESGARIPEPETLDSIARALDLNDRQALYLFLDAYVPERLHRHLED